MDEKDFFTDHYHYYCHEGIDPEAIVISGISGRFPESDNVGEYRDAVYKKESLIKFTDERFAKGVFKNPYSSCGNIKNTDKIDAGFFFLTHAAVHGLDPATRIHQEVAYECIFDAGYNPDELKGANIGLYNATTGDDGQRINLVQNNELQLHNIRTMHANRSSYIMDLKGPSHTIDSACSSSAIAFHTASEDLKHGNVDAAIVSGCQLNLDPEKTTAYFMAGIASLAGNSIPYDAESDGMLRTEAISAIFLQKAKHARRIYAVVLGTRYQSSGYVPEGISVPSGKMQVYTLKRLLKECGIHPNQIQYVEGHGTGTQVGDPIEVNAMADLFLNEEYKREGPLYLGSSKSNVGHTEATSGIIGCINAIFALESNLIPPNLNYKTPNPRCPALMEGRIIVPSDSIPVESPYIPVNCFGFGGTIVEVLLKRGPVTEKQQQQTERKIIPMLLLYSATTDEAVTYIFEYLKTHEDPGDSFYAMFNKLAYTAPLAKPYRGYSIFYDNHDPVIQTKVVSGDKRQVWFIMTGMGCQWAGMGLQLMAIDVFSRSMKKSAEVLKRVNIDLFELLRADKNYLEMDRKILPAFVSISAIQIALVDLLRHVGIEPDGIIGHSTGEIICAYADGCCTAEETIMSAYFRGICVEAGHLERGSMAAVGLSWEEAERRCPEGIYPACDNSADSVTISGPKDLVDKFVEELKTENIFARVVNAYGYAFHSKYVHPIADDLKSNLQKMLKSPKRRSPRWVSTSYPESEWELEEAQVADAEYFVHNLMSPVRFTSGLKKIPPNAVTIELGPHHLLQSILKRGCGAETSHIGLMKRNHADNVHFFFEALGKLYNEGLDPKIERLYPPVQFPVPKGSPVLSDLIKWNHSLSFRVPKYNPRTGPFDMDIRPDKGDSYLLDHRIDGRSLFPATGYIWLVWEVFAFRTHRKLEETPVIIEHFKIHRATVMTPQASVRMTCTILTGTGYFEVKEGNQLVASGFIRDGKDLTYDEKSPTYVSEDKAVSGADLYNELKMAGYEYGPHFQSLLEMSMNESSGLIAWRNKWIPFLDCMLLFFGILEKRQNFYLPTGARTVRIDPMVFLEFISKKCDESGVEYPEDTVPVTYNPNNRTCRSVGIEIKALDVDIASLRASTDVPTTEEYKFISYLTNYTPENEKQVDLKNYMGMCNKLMRNIQILSKNKVALTEFPDYPIDSDMEEQFTNTQCSDRVLLNLLMDVSNDINQIKNNGSRFSPFTKDMGMDVLNSILIDPDVLRGVMEIIMENSYKKLSVLELNQNSTLVIPTLMKMSADNAHLKFKRNTLVVSSIEKVEQEVVSKHNIQLLEGTNLESLDLSKKEDILISSFTTGSESDLQKLISSLNAFLEPNGFLVLYFKEKLSPGEKFVSSLFNVDPQVRSQTDLLRVLLKENLTVLSKVSDSIGGVSLYLLRSSSVPEHPDKVIQIQDNTFSWVEEVKKELYGEGDGEGRLWLVSQDSLVSGIVGMVNCLKQEPKGDRIRCVFICQNPKETKLPSFDFENPFYKPLSERNLVMNVWKDGAWGSYRHILIKEHKVPQLRENSYVYVYKSGDFSSIKWTESPAKCISESQYRSLVHVYYSALNFKDVMLASGKISLEDEGAEDKAVNDTLIGLEFSGRDASGKRVFGFSGGSGICTTLMAGSPYVHNVPDHWTLEEAATVPIVYGTCYYALIARGRLAKGESILIHSGTGGIGIAAIRIALSLECEIFTTVGTEEKRQYLKQMFPQLKEENIGCSRNVTFEKMVMDGTKGVGVDVVLNSLADEKFHASLRCVARYGRFLEIGKYDMLLDTRIGMKWFTDDRQFHGIALDKVFDMKPKSKKIADLLWTLTNEGIRKGVVQPLDRTVFEWNQVEEAFRYMAKGLHKGKILIKIRDEEKDQTIMPKPVRLPVIPKTFFHDRKTYIVVGGLGGFGIEVTNWMIIRGARKVILTSRFGARTPYHHLCLKRWQKELVDVRVSTLNVAKRDEAEKLLKEAEKMGPVGGVFNSAVVLKDAFMDSQTPEDFKEVNDPKGAASRYLDELTRVLCPKMDYFVCFSSMSCGRGNAGQTNYGFANSVMERVCEQRKRDGLHGLSIQWGIIGGVGVVHRHMGDDAMIAGVIAQNAKSCLAKLDDFLQEGAPVVSSYMAAVERKKLRQGDVLTQIGKVLGMSVDQINPSRSFGTMGIDSMVGVELKQLLDSACGCNLSIQEIQDLRIGDVKDMLEKAEADKPAAEPGQSLMATTSLRLPPTLVNLDLPRLMYNQMGLGYPTFFLKLGDENVEDLNQLISLIERPIGVVLWMQSLPTSDIHALVKRLYAEMSESVYFNLVACSISANVALAIALLSQKIDKRCKSITILNGSDVLVKTMNPEECEEEDKEVEIFCRFVDQFGTVDTFKLREELKKAPNLDQRIKTLAQFIESVSNRAVDKGDITTAVNDFITKTRLVESYIPTEKLTMDITLIEDPLKVLPNDVTKIKETFSKVVTGKVNVHRVCGIKDLINPDEALKVANIISAL